MDREGASMTDESRPLGGLPPADRNLLAAPPLELAIVEIRFTPTSQELNADAGLLFRESLERLGVSFARIEPVLQQRINVSMQAGVTPATQVDAITSGWLLIGADPTYQITVLPGAVVFQTSKYERWSVSFKPKLEALVQALAEIISPEVVLRLGLRYVDRFVDMEAHTPASWSGRLQSSFLGPVADQRIAHLVSGAQQQVELSLGSSQGALLRHGPFVDPAAHGAVSYMLDIDVFDTAPNRFEPNEIVKRCEALNRAALSLFQMVLTPEYLISLQDGSSRSKDEIPE